jgi:hypothetical protein
MGRRRLAPKFIEASLPRQLTRQQCEQFKLRGRLPVHAPSLFASEWAKSETRTSREICDPTMQNSRPNPQPAALLTAVSRKSRIVKLVKYGYVRVSWSVSPQEQ